MTSFVKVAFSACVIVAALSITPSQAVASTGVSFGFTGPGVLADPCDYYDTYDRPPPWGLPPDYCDYPVYYDPVFVGGTWYRGPIYYRWAHGQRLFWLHGGWRADVWRGARPRIAWRDVGGWNHGFRPGMNIRGSMARPQRAPGSGFYQNSRPWFGGGGYYSGNRPGGGHH